MPATEQTTTHRRSVATRRASRPTEGERHGASTPPTSIFPECSMPCRSRRRSPTAESRSSTRPQPRRCPACARFFIARTSERSSVRPSGQGFDGICHERRPPFEDDVVRYYGQYVALAVADTFESAKAAADAVRVTYAKEKPNVETDLKADDDPDMVDDHVTARRKRLQSERGDRRQPLSPARRSSSTRPMSRRPKRTTPSSCRRRPRSGTATT